MKVRRKASKIKKPRRFIYRVNFVTNRGRGWRRITADGPLTIAGTEQLEKVLEQNHTAERLVITDVKHLNKVGSV